VAITVPHEWRVTNEPLDYISDPIQRLVVSSYRVPRGGPNASGTYVVPPGQVLAQLDEQVPPDADAPGFPQRPTRFAVPRLTNRLEGHTGRWGEITFRQRGRDFYLFVGVGVGADGQIRLGRLLGLLDGLKVAKAP